MRALFEQALQAKEQGQFEQSEQLLLQIASQAHDIEDFDLQIRCLEELTDIARVQQATHNLIRWLKKHYTLIKKHNHKRAAELCMDIASVCFKRGEHDDGKIWAKKAFDLGQANWYREVMAEAQLLLGMIFFKEQNLEHARIFFRRSYSLFDELGNSSGVYQSLFHMGLVRHTIKDFPKARSIFLECLERCDVDNITITSDLHLRLALVCQTMESLVESLYHALMAWEGYRTLQSKRKEMVWRILFVLKDLLGEEDFNKHITFHFDEQQIKKFHFLFLEAQKAHKEKQEQKTVASKKQDKPPPPTLSKTLVFTEGEEDSTEKINITQHNTAATEAIQRPKPTKTNIEPSTLSDITLSELPPPPVIELELLKEEVFEEVPDIEVNTFKKEESNEDNGQLIRLILVFFVVFFVVFFSIYFISHFN